MVEREVRQIAKHSSLFYELEWRNIWICATWIAGFRWVDLIWEHYVEKCQNSTHLLPKKSTSTFLLEGLQQITLSHCAATRNAGLSTLPSVCRAQAMTCWPVRWRPSTAWKRDSSSAAKRRRERSSVPNRRYKKLSKYTLCQLNDFDGNFWFCFSGVRSLIGTARLGMVDRSVARQMISTVVSSQFLQIHFITRHLLPRNPHWARCVIPRLSTTGGTAVHSGGFLCLFFSEYIYSTIAENQYLWILNI